MVVGTSAYKDQQEAYPLDKKTLRKVAMRSFFMKGAKNSENVNAIGYAWAMQPALQKIHTNDEDLALSLGQALEWNSVSDLFATFVMGMILSMEAQKADPAVMRGLKTSLSLLLKSLEKIVLYFFLMPLLIGVVYNKTASFQTVFISVYLFVLGLLSVVSRFYLMNLGYKHGVRIFESVMKKKEALKNASEVAGVFAFGAFAVTMTTLFGIGNLFGSSNLTIVTNVFNSYVVIVIGIFGLSMMLLSHYLLVKKQKSITYCGLVCVLACVVFGVLLASF